MQNSMPTATLTKTKVKVHHVALIGIAAACTALALGAFTASFAIVASGVRIATVSSIAQNLLPNSSFELGQPQSTTNWDTYRTYQASVSKSTIRRSGSYAAVVRTEEGVGGGLYKRFNIGD